MKIVYMSTSILGKMIKMEYIIRNKLIYWQNLFNKKVKIGPLNEQEYYLLKQGQYSY